MPAPVGFEFDVAGVTLWVGSGRIG